MSEKQGMNKRWMYARTALFLGLALYYVIALNSEMAFLEDIATYVVLAESLASGQGYTFVSYVGDPSYTLAPPLFRSS